jgi:serine/threonine-protein kinase
VKRDVAIKILPDEFSRDADPVSRFQLEAEVLASLNHPNIAAIHDLREANGSRYLVLELVEGETLQERLKRGPIPIDDALPIARQIADALEAAHESGIVHRDLKPANIMLAPDGRVKVLDFGLGKAFQQQATTVSNSPTLASASLPGVILGTAGYMSPEQAKGKEANRSSDIWAFGAAIGSHSSLDVSATNCLPFVAIEFSSRVNSLFDVHWGSIETSEPLFTRTLPTPPITSRSTIPRNN